MATVEIVITKNVLYQLSYSAIKKIIGLKEHVKEEKGGWAWTWRKKDFKIPKIKKRNDQATGIEPKSKLVYGKRIETAKFLWKINK